MSSPATLTVGHVLAIVSSLHPDDLTPSGRAVFLVACHTAELAHAERQRPAVTDTLYRFTTRRMPDAVGFLGPLT